MYRNVEISPGPAWGPKGSTREVWAFTMVGSQTGSVRLQAHFCPGPEFHSERPSKKDAGFRTGIPDEATEQEPLNYHDKHFLARTLTVLHRVIGESRVSLQGLCSSKPGDGLETTLCGLRDELKFNRATQYRVFVTGHPFALHPVAHQQI